MQERLLLLPEVLARVPGRRAWLYKEIAAGRFPRPLKIGKISCWPESTVDTWVKIQVEEGEKASAS